MSIEVIDIINCDQIYEASSSSLAGDIVVETGIADKNIISNRKKYTKNISDDISNLEFPDDIKRQAQIVYEELGRPTHKGNKRNKLIVFCLLEAHKIKKVATTQAEIAEKLGIKTGKTSKIKAFSRKSNTNYRPLNVIFKPQDFIEEHLKLVSLENHLPEVLELSDRIMEKSDILEDKKPQYVSLCIVKYFLTSNGIQYDQKKLNIKVKIASTTLNPIYQHVVEADNNL